MTRNEFESKIFSALNEFLGHEEYKHWVFCAGKPDVCPQNAKAIEAAKKAVEYLEDLWEMNADIHGHYEGPEFIIHEDGSNVEIEAVSSDLHTLINGCMAFAREMERYEGNNKK